MDCDRAGWTDDFHFSPFAAQRKDMGEFDAVLMEIQEFVSGRAKQHLILGGDFDVSLYGMTDFYHVEEPIPRPRTLVDTSDSLRARALHTMVAELHLTVTNTWMNADTEQRTFHTIRLVKTRRFVDTNGFHHYSEKTGNETCSGSGLRLVQDGSQRGACCSFAETENEIHEEKWSELAWLGADDSWHRVAAETLTEWENWNAMVPLLMETARTHRRMETKELSVTELELKSLLLLFAGRQLGRSELNWLCREIWRKRRAFGTREESGKDQGECRDGEILQEKAKQAFQLELRCKTRKPRICSSKTST